jgi:hypothetical protein
MGMRLTLRLFLHVGLKVRLALPCGFNSVRAAMLRFNVHFPSLLNLAMQMCMRVCHQTWFMIASNDTDQHTISPRS